MTTPTPDDAYPDRPDSGQPDDGAPPPPPPPLPPAGAGSGGDDDEGAPDFFSMAEPADDDQEEPDSLLFSDTVVDQPMTSTATDTPESLQFSDTVAPGGDDDASAGPGLADDAPGAGNFSPVSGTGDTARVASEFESAGSAAAGASPDSGGMSIPADVGFPADDQPPRADTPPPAAAASQPSSGSHDEVEDAEPAAASSGSASDDHADDPFQPVTVGAVVAAAAQAARDRKSQASEDAAPRPDPDTGKMPTGTPAAPSSPADASERTSRVVWFVHANREQLGPFSTAEVAERLRAGHLLPKHWAWRLDFGEEWKRLRDIADFRPAIEAFTGVAIADAGGTDRLRCTNCRTPVHDDWMQCPECGLQLKAELRPVAARIVAEPVHRAFAMAGGAVAVLAMFLPWLTSSGNTGDPASIAGLHVPLGELLTLTALFLGFFTLQAMAGGPHRALLTWLVAVASGLLATLFWIQSGGTLPGLQAEAAAATAGEAGVSLGFWVYAAGVAVVLLANLVPALIRLVQRPLLGVSIIAVLALVGLGVLQLVNGNLYEPLLRIQLESAGYDVEIETLTPPVDVDVDADADAEAVGADRPRRASTRTLLIRAWRTDDGGEHLFVGRHEYPLGSLWPTRTVHLQAVPDVDRGLFPPRETDDDGDDADRAEGGTG